jgi:hypothetical protein
VSRFAEHFTQAYQTAGSNRDLVIEPSRGEITLRYTPDPKTGRQYRLELTTIQGMMLLYFNQQPVWRISDLVTASKTDPRIVIPALAPMLFGPVAVLIHVVAPQGKKINIQDQIRVNPRPQTKSLVIRVPRGNYESNETRKRQDDELQKQREFAIQSMVVRLMKSRKQLSYEGLIAEVIKEISRIGHFNPEVKLIKLMIEALIEREYLERDEKDSRLLHYVA